MKQITFIFILLINISFVNAGIMQSTIVNASVPVDVEKRVINGDLKKGESVVGSYLWLITFGDSSIREAAKNGNIKEIVYVDRKQASISFLGLFGIYKFKTTVYGY